MIAVSKFVLTLFLFAQEEIEKSQKIVKVNATNDTTCVYRLTKYGSQDDFSSENISRGKIMRETRIRGPF